MARWRRVSIRRAGLAVACLALAACDRDGGPLATDVRDLLQPAGVSPQPMTCRMVGQTRMGVCALSLTDTETASVVRALALTDTTASRDAASIADFVFAQAKGDCIGDAGSRRAVFVASGRPQALRLPGGTAFEELVLTVDLTTRQACIHASYAYG
jgi:hypothetical protein